MNSKPSRRRRTSLPGLFALQRESSRCAAILLATGLLLGADQPPDVQTFPDAPIENLYRLGTRLYSGAAPEGTQAFELLKKLGVRTVISVDGAAPDVDAARKAGLRYVHLPIGYDGVPADKALLLIKAARELPGPVFVHCHHGLHRGPAAAAVCARAVEGWSTERAITWMKQAGTALEYRGLYRSVETLLLPDADRLALVPAEFPERAPVSTTVEVMVQIDQEWDRLKSAAGSRFAPPAAGEDPPAHAALKLAELFRELARSENSARRGEKFVTAAKSADHVATALEQSLVKLRQAPGDDHRTQALVAYQAVARQCKSCHTQFRDE